MLPNLTPDGVWCQGHYQTFFYATLIAKVKLLLKIHKKMPDDIFREIEVLFMALILLRYNQKKQEIPDQLKIDLKKKEKHHGKTNHQL